MSTNVIIDNVKSLAAQYQAVIDLANQLSELASIEQATTEATAALGQAQAARDQGLQDLQAVNAALDQARSDLVDAQNKANQILVEANDQASQLLTQAHDDANAIKALANAARSAALTDVQELQVSLDNISAQLIAKQSELADVEHKIASTKAAALAALGA